MDGVLYIDASINTDTYSFEIRNEVSMPYSLISFATWIATCEMEEDGFSSYLVEYLANVYKEVSHCINPKPYISMHAARTLRHYFSKINKSSSVESKVIDLGGIGGM